MALALTSCTLMSKCLRSTLRLYDIYGVRRPQESPPRSLGYPHGMQGDRMDF